MRRLLILVLLAAGFSLGAAISYFNWTVVSFDYLSGQAELPLIALLLTAFLLGVLVMGLLDLARIWGLKRESRKLQNRLSRAETDLKNLRAIDLAAPSALPVPPASPAEDMTGKNA